MTLYSCKLLTISGWYLDSCYNVTWSTALLPICPHQAGLGVNSWVVSIGDSYTLLLTWVLNIKFKWVNTNYLWIFSIKKKILSTKRENMLDPIQKDLHQKCNDITPLSHVTMEKWCNNDLFSVHWSTIITTTSTTWDLLDTSKQFHQ